MEKFTERDYRDFFASTEKFDDMRDVLDIVGINLFKKLIHTFGGLAVYFPTLQGIEKIKRDAKIMKMIKQGVSYRKIANKFDLSVRTVYYIKRKNKHINTPQ